MGTSLPIHARLHAMLIGTPRREMGEIVEYSLGIRVKNVRTVAMDENAGVVIEIISIAADVRPADRSARRSRPSGCQPLRQHAAGKSRADDQVIKHWLPPSDADSADAGSSRRSQLGDHSAECQ